MVHASLDGVHHHNYILQVLLLEYEFYIALFQLRNNHISYS